MSFLHSQLTIAIGLLMVACVSCTSDLGLASSESSDDTNYFSEAQSLLSDGQLEAARTQFSNGVTFGQFHRAESYVGLALTELMLLPESDAVTNLLLGLGADPARLPLDIERDLAGPDSFLERLQRGASEQLVTEALYRLFPWPSDAVDTGPSAMFASIPASATINDLRPALVDLETQLASIEGLLQTALNQGLTTYTIPQGTLFTPRPHVLRRSELHTMIGTIKLVRALIHAALAYDWPISLRAVLANIDGDAMALTTVADALNPEFMRSLWAGRTGDPDGLTHLAEAQRLGALAFEEFVNGINVGLEEEQAGQRGVLDWTEMTTSEVNDLRTILTELRSFVGDDVPVEFSYSEPHVSGTLAPFFAGTVLRGQQAPPFWQVAQDLQLGGAQLEANDAALSALLIEPLFEPAFDPVEGLNICGRASIAAVMQPDALERFESELSADYNF